MKIDSTAFTRSNWDYYPAVLSSLLSASLSHAALMGHRTSWSKAHAVLIAGVILLCQQKLAQKLPPASAVDPLDSLLPRTKPMHRSQPVRTGLCIQLQKYRSEFQVMYELTFLPRHKHQQNGTCRQQKVTRARSLPQHLRPYLLGGWWPAGAGNYADQEWKPLIPSNKPSSITPSSWLDALL